MEGCYNRAIILLSVPSFRYSHISTETKPIGQVSDIAAYIRTLHPFPPSPSPPPTHIPNSYLPNMCSFPSTPGYSRIEYSTSPPESFGIDPTDTTQEVKKGTVSEEGPGHPMERVKPQHLGTYVCTIHAGNLYSQAPLHKTLYIPPCVCSYMHLQMRQIDMTSHFSHITFTFKYHSINAHGT